MPRFKKTEPKKPDTSTPKTAERIAKIMARAGLCSRRDAEAWIKDGRVQVDGQTILSPALNVDPSLQEIHVDGKILPKNEEILLWKYYKPRGLVTSHKDELGRQTVFDALPSHMPRVISVGRLDLNSEGLLLLTNSGTIARYMELPQTAWKRRYRVRLNGEPDQHQLDSLKKGITIEGVKYGAVEATMDRQQGHNAWVTVTLTEGKNREIRRIMEHFGWKVSRLIRLSYGPFNLGDMKEGMIEAVPSKIIKHSLGNILD